MIKSILITVSVLLCAGVAVQAATTSRRPPDSSYTECYSDGSCAQVSEWEYYSEDDSSSSDDYNSNGDYANDGSSDDNVPATNYYSSSLNSNQYTLTSTNTLNNNSTNNYYGRGGGRHNHEHNRYDYDDSKPTGKANQGGNGGLGFNGNVDFNLDGSARGTQQVEEQPQQGGNRRRGGFGDILRQPGNIASDVVNGFSSGILGGVRGGQGGLGVLGGRFSGHVNGGFGI